MKMNPRRHEAQPGFLWQGILIVLPIVLLAGLGLYSLRQDRAMVLEEARARSRESLQALTPNLGRQVAGQLTFFDAFAYGWVEQHRNGFGGWPGSEHRSAVQKDTSVFESYLNQWARQFPEVPPLDGLPLTITFSETGMIYHPRSYEPAPSPPAWVTGVYPVEGGHREAKLYAEWLQLRSRSVAEPAAEAATHLLGFARKAWNADSPSGVPLSTVALLEVLKHCRQAGFSQTIWEALREDIENRPSILTPVLLETLNRTCEARSELTAEAAALGKLWAFRERERAAATLLQGKVSLRGVVTTNMWMGKGTERVLCIANPSEMVTLTSSNGTRLSITNQTTQVRIYPRFLVERALALATEKAGLRLPAYAESIVYLEGERFGGGANGATNAVLAETSVSLTQPGTFLLEPPATGQPLKTGPEFETLPSAPRLKLQVVLSDPSTLFAMQRRRQWLFALLIGASTFAAGAGLIGARRAFRKQLRLSQLKDNFVSSVSHELRAPIASVRLMTESLEKQKVTDPARQQEYFRLMSQECRRLSALIGNVLDFSRIEQGRKEYEFEPTDVPALVQDTVSVMQASAEERQVRLELVLPPRTSVNGGLQATLDGKAIQQALINLLDNALKHSPAGAAVTIGLEAETESGPGGGVCIWVEDKGPGIPAEEHEKIFDRFYRLGSELRRETQGVGIGLSIVKHIVEAHGGTVSVRSAVGKGSRFVVRLPGKGQG